MSQQGNILVCVHIVTAFRNKRRTVMYVLCERCVASLKSCLTQLISRNDIKVSGQYPAMLMYYVCCLKIKLNT